MNATTKNLEINELMDDELDNVVGGSSFGIAKYTMRKKFEDTGTIHKPKSRFSFEDTGTIHKPKRRVRFDDTGNLT